MFGATEKSIGERGVAPIDPSNGEDVLFSHNFIGVFDVGKMDVSVVLVFVTDHG